MRHIHLDEDHRVRFPGRTEEFDQGVEIGIVAALMVSDRFTFTQRLAAANLDQARSIAEKFGYHVVVDDAAGDWAEITFRAGRARPKLALVHSNPDRDRSSAMARLSSVTR